MGVRTHLADPDNPDDPQASVEASLLLSYDALEPPAQSALCQASVLPLFDLDLVKAVVQVEGDVVEVLELLQRRNLLEWNATDGQFAFHDLVRLFALNRLTNHDEVERRAAEYIIVLGN